MGFLWQACSAKATYHQRTINPKLGDQSSKTVVIVKGKDVKRFVSAPNIVWQEQNKLSGTPITAF